MVQVPETRSVTVEPEMVHTVAVVEAKLTGNPELAVAVNVIDEAAGWLVIAAKLRVWLFGVGGPDGPHPTVHMA